MIGSQTERDREGKKSHGLQGREREDLKDGDRELVRDGESRYTGAGRGLEGAGRKKKPKSTAVWEREGSRGEPGMQKRGDRAPRARHSPQLSLSALPRDSAASDASLSCSPPFLFRNSGRLAVLHLRENAHVLHLLGDEAP